MKSWAYPEKVKNKLKSNAKENRQMSANTRRLCSLNKPKAVINLCSFVVKILFISVFLMNLYDLFGVIGIDSQAVSNFFGAKHLLDRQSGTVCFWL